MPAPGVELAMLALVLVVLPLVMLYAGLRAMVVVGHALERTVRRWHASLREYD